MLLGSFERTLPFDFRPASCNLQINVAHQDGVTTLSVKRLTRATMGNCDSKGTHVRGGRGGIRHRRIKSEHKHQGPIYWKYHENTSALEYYEPIRSIGEGSIGSIHLVRRRPKKIHDPYQECLEIIIDSTDHIDSSSASSSDDGGSEAEGKVDQNQTQEQLFVLKSILKDHLQDDECLDEMRSEIYNMKFLGETSVLNGMILLILARLYNMRCLYSRSRCPRKKHEATSSVSFMDALSGLGIHVLFF